MKLTYLSASLGVSGLLLASCGTNGVKTEGQQVTIRVEQGDARLVRLEVIGPKIIRVSATSENRFADPQSLIIIPQQQGAAYQMTQSGDTVTVATSALSAHVLRSTGEVWFTDADGNIVLQEQPGGGKSIQPYTAQQTVYGPNGEGGTPTTYHGYTTRVVFDSPEDEAFFGLGQHQADEWNYKGRNEELFQYNTKVSIPFVVSSRNYGILYDSYSLMRFGNPEDYQQLGDVFTLANKEGQEGSLTGTYTSPTQPTLVRDEQEIYFENLKSAKNLPTYDLNDAKVVYEGTLTPSVSGEYHFSHYYSGYQKIYINGKDVYTDVLCDSPYCSNAKGEQTIWRTAWNPNARKFSVDMEEGETYDIRLEWVPDGGEAYCGLRVMSPREEKEQQQLSLWSEMSQQIDYYFVLGENTDEVISGYRTLTGKAQIMPKWLLGFWQSRERYRTQDEILDALQGFRQRHLPIDNIVMDWNYWTPDAWGAFTFDPTRFADPKAMIDSIHAQHAKIMISCWPKYYLTVDNKAELEDKGYIYQQSIKDSIYDWLGYKYCFYDAYAPEARHIFWRQLYEKLATIGMDAWWMDASEPNIRDCTDLEYRKLLCGPTAYGSSDEFFNAYSIVNAEAIYDGQRGYETAVERQGIDPQDSHSLQAKAQWNQMGYGNEKNFSPENKRVFLLTRNGFASEQRYSTATWSGDIGTRWEDMKAQITAGLNFSISGVPYWSQDIGGFSVEKRYEAAQREYDRTGRETEDLREWRELNVRWHEWGVFTPMYRVHGQFPYREPWNIAPESHPAYRVISSMLDLRYRMMPYLYSLAAQVHYDDYTLLRPLVMDFGYDTNTYDVAYQFMCGPALMVAPVYTYKARQRKVYFPMHQTWYDFYTGELTSNGQETQEVAAPYEHCPVYVRSGSIIPFGPAMEYTSQRPADHIRLFVYRGADGAFTLYEDEGDNYGYEAGRFARIPFTLDDATGILTIGERQGSFPGMLQERTFTIVNVSAEHPVPYNPEAHGITVQYDGNAQTIQL